MYVNYIFFFEIKLCNYVMLMSKPYYANINVLIKSCNLKVNLYFVQIPNNTSNITTSTSNTVTGSQPQVLQLQNNTQTLSTNSNGVLQLVQQVITPTGEIQHIPVSKHS